VVAVVAAAGTTVGADNNKHKQHWERQKRWSWWQREQSSGGCGERVMALVTRVVCDEEGNDDGSKSDGNEGGRRATAMRAMATATVMTWAMVTAMRVVGNKKGNGKVGKGDGNSDEVGRQ
jgi:hypothetical protein